MSAIGANPLISGDGIIHPYELKGRTIARAGSRCHGRENRRRMRGHVANAAIPSRAYIDLFSDTVLRGSAIRRIRLDQLCFTSF